jgi:hypothetical protein
LPPCCRSPSPTSTPPKRSATCGASAGDITCYPPWGNLALFYCDFGYSDGLVRLVCLDPGAADVLADVDDDTTVSIGAAE